MGPPVALFTLPLFPEGSLASSVVTTVWIGVFVCVFFNLRLGWTLSGLVVPGYLVPLLITKPLAAAVVFGEGILTYFLVWLFSELLSRRGKWSNLFGRDRFFALILCSILVRVTLDGYLLPYIARAASARWLTDFDFASNLHSFGLIIIALIANQFWKPGLRRGIGPVVTMIGVTYLLVRYPLMHWTNFSIASLEFMYEDVSASVFASPKAYIVLVCTAFIASRLNLYYAWEFNGIMIPSLLALQWYEPLKILTSFVEAWMIYSVASLVLRTPLLRETTMEGGRKILLFFNLSFLYKLLLGHLLLRTHPTIQVTDCFGFGYLLPSLLALKMHDKGIPERITRTTLQASLLGTVAASVVGFSLTLLPQDWLWSLAKPEASAEVLAATPGGDLDDRLRADKVIMYQQRLATAAVAPMQRELDAFTSGMRHLRAFAVHGLDDDLARARRWLREAGFRVLEMEDDLLYVREVPPERGWGAYVLRRGVARGLVVEVPAPLEEWATLESGAYLFGLFRGSALAISTASEQAAGGEGHSVARTRRSFFHAFHRVIAAQDIVQVRGYTASAARVLLGVRLEADGVEDADIQSSLWVRSDLPASLSLRALKEIVGRLRIEWKTPPLPNLQRDTARAGFADLYLTRDDRKRLLGRFLLGNDAGNARGTTEQVAASASVDGIASLEEWALTRKADLAPRGSNLYRAPEPEMLLYLDEEVLTPLVRLQRDSRYRDLDQVAIASELQAADAVVRTLGYRVLRFRESGSRTEFVILTERRDAEAPRFWGTYVFRLGAYEPYVVEIPHPGYERNTLEYGVPLFESLRAGALLVAGSHPKCNTDGSADVVRVENKTSLFNLVNQVHLRETGDSPWMVVQVRAFGHKPGAVLPEADALLSLYDGAVRASQLSPLGRRLLPVFEEDRIHVDFVDGSYDTTGYEAHGSAQARYLPHTRNKEFAAVWLSPYTRLGYRQDTDRDDRELSFRAVGVGTSREALDERVLASRLVADEFTVPSALVRSIESFQTTRDLNLLRAITTRWPELRLHRVIDGNTQKAFLLVLRDGELLPLIAKLTLNRDAFLDPWRGGVFRVERPLRAEAVKRFAESSARLLLVRSGS